MWNLKGPDSQEQSRLVIAKDRTGDGRERSKGTNTQLSGERVWGSNGHVVTMVDNVVLHEGCPERIQP